MLVGCAAYIKIFTSSPADYDQDYIHALEVLRGLTPTTQGTAQPSSEHGAAAASPATLATFTPTAPLRGNQLAIVGGAQSTPSSPTGAILVRESNCTLTQYEIGNVNGTTSTITSTLPNADAYLHLLSGLTTTAGAFPRGCVDRTKGVPSAPAVYLGKASNGELLSAVADPSGKISLLRVTTLGVLVSQTVLLDANAASTLAAIDLNGDGIADIVSPFVTVGGVNGIGLFLSHADGSFDPVMVYPGYAADASRFAARVSIEDVNGDGKLDIVAVAGSVSGLSSPTVVTLLGAGNGAFAAGPIAVKGIDDGPYVLADFDGDGRIDLLMGSGLLMLGNGDGSFGSPVQRLNVPAALGRNLAIGDFNGDGILDVAVRDGSIITVLLGRGDGTFVIKASYAAIRGADFLSVVDVDGDGNADIVVGLSGPGIYGPNLRSQTVTQFLLGKGDGTFAASQAIPAVGISLLASAPTFALTDFNGDGYPDLIVRSSSSTTTVSMLAGSASANFSAEVAVATLGFRPELFAAGDVDGDGKADLIAVGSSLAVLKGTGGGSFAPPQIYALPAVTGSLVNLTVGDFNGDGKADVLVIMGGQSASSGGAFIYFANSDGTLKAPLQIDNATNLRAVAVGDLDGDKRVDIAVAGLDPQFYSSPDVLRGVRVYRGNADSSFSLPLTLNPGGAYSALAIGDLNKDGKADLVIGSFDKSLNDTVYILPGLGDGSFGTAIAFPLPGGGPGIAALALGDFTGDGNVDVLFAGGSYTGLLVGNGDGSVAGLGAITLASGSAFVATADLDKDGRIDAVLAVANQGLVPLLQVTSAIPPVSTVPAGDFAVALSSSDASVAPGQPARTVLNIGFGTGFTQPVSFSCAGLPVNASCAFSPASVTPGSGTSTTVTIGTGGSSAAGLALDTDSTGRGQFGAAGIVVMGAAAIARRRRGATGRALDRSLVFGLLALTLGSCGGSDGAGAIPGTPPTVTTPSGTYRVTINAASASVTKSALFTLTVE